MQGLSLDRRIVMNMSHEDLARRLVRLKGMAEKDQFMERYLQFVALPGNLEYVQASKRQRAYYRRRPYSRDNPGPGQAQHRLEFSVIATENFSKKGVVTMPDGREISKTAYLIGKKLKKATREGSESEQEVQRLTKLLSAAPESCTVIKVPWK